MRADLTRPYNKIKRIVKKYCNIESNVLLLRQLEKQSISEINEMRVIRMKNEIDRNNCYVVEGWITFDWTDEGRWFFDNEMDALEFWETESDNGADFEIFKTVDGKKQPIEF